MGTCCASRDQNTNQDNLNEIYEKEADTQENLM